MQPLFVYIKQRKVKRETENGKGKGETERGKVKTERAKRTDNRVNISVSRFSLSAFRFRFQFSALRFLLSPFRFQFSLFYHFHLHDNILQRTVGMVSLTRLYLLYYIQTALHFAEHSILAVEERSAAHSSVCLRLLSGK